MTDPVKMLIDAGAIPSSPFGPSSRYASIPVARYTFPAGTGDDATVTYVLRRFIPQARDIPLATRHALRANDRGDLIAAAYLGDAELNWRVADANLATDLISFTSSPGERIAVPLPPGASGA
jgi:hypothetical protein